jgi:hypothetical protein
MRLTTFAFWTSLLASGVACSAPSNDPASQSSDLASTKAPDPRFKVFASQDAAFAWATDFEKKYAAMQGAPVRTQVAPSDPRYATATKVVGDLWRAFGQLYPDRIAGLPAPYVVILEDPTVNAYAVYDPDLKQMADTFFILTGALGSATAPVSEGALYGLVGHELTHLLLLHKYPGVDRSIYYQVHGAEELGFLQEQDANAQSAIEQWTDLSQWVGDFPYPEFNGVPLLAGATLNQLLAPTVARASSAASPPPACAQAYAAGKAANDFMLATFDQVNFLWPLTDDQKTQASKLTTTLASAVHDCLAGGPTFVQALAQMNNLDEATARSALGSDPDMAPQLDNPNVMDAVVAVTNAKFAKLQALQKQYDYSTMRVRTYEEEADDNSMLTTHLLRKDSKGIGEFLFQEALPSDAARGQCTSILNAGNVPGYGMLADPHHGTCYRVYHVNLFNKLIFNKRDASTSRQR